MFTHVISHMTVMWWYDRLDVQWTKQLYSSWFPTNKHVQLFELHTLNPCTQGTYRITLGGLNWVQVKAALSKAEELSGSLRSRYQELAEGPSQRREADKAARNGPVGEKNKGSSQNSSKSEGEDKVRSWFVQHLVSVAGKVLTGGESSPGHMWATFTVEYVGIFEFSKFCSMCI